MNINWFPGHMKKAAEEVREHLALVDIVVEMLDARIPHSSSNPMLDKILGEKRRIKVLTKIDLSDDASVSKFVKHYDAIPVNSLTGEGIRKLKDRIADLSAEVNERLKLRGRKPREIRVMVVGIPNVGKSSLINKIAGKNVCKSANKPGVTRGRQWIHIAKGISLCDTAGILWPKFEDPDVGVRLALTGAIRDEILSTEEVVLQMLNRETIKIGAANYYGIDVFGDSRLMLTEIARRRGFLLQGAQVDILKASRLVLDDFRAGRLGKFFLD